MAATTLTPDSQTSTVVLPSTGSYTEASDTTNYPYAVYVDTSSQLYDANFVTGAVEQVTYIFRKLGGDILDLEVTDKNIYSAYEEAVLEYSYIVNIHQSKNILHSSLGATTGTFDSDGQRTDSASGSNVELKYPKFQFGYAKKVMDNTIKEVGLGGTDTIYSASFNTTSSDQDYNLQSIISSSANDSGELFYNKVGNNRIIIRKVYYKTPHSMWRFYGYYGGMNTVGNMSTYGMYGDDSTFEVIPAWQNKLQAMAYEDAIYTRNSHYSYEIKNNQLRLFPIPSTMTPHLMWVEFTVKKDPWEEDDDRLDGAEGINNMNTLPLSNLPYKNINSIGKQWIRRFCLAVVKETLGEVRSKFASIPIPGQSVTLNGTALITQAREEQKSLREELQKILDELTYQKITEIQSEMSKNTQDIVRTYPYFIYTG
jgi:hypothetical protein|tara:strand:- start:35381 stop:36658 length:1278 start_codon:yes stop_codon:yes gene_type:complete